MTLRIVLLTPARRFIANRAGLGWQVPLGLVLLGGPLLDAGHRVELVDNDALGLSDDALVARLAVDPPDVVMIGHTGSTAAHPVAARSAQALRTAFPATTIVYGGPYPSYAARHVLATCPAFDVVVHGEGEATVVELAAAVASDPCRLGHVAGITWRAPDGIERTADRAPIEDLDAHRPGWELVDWDRYAMFGFGRAAGLQFSRGCTLSCTYCGQWSFWRRWRHRSPENVADQLQLLAERHGVKIVWFADENFAADREQARAVLEAIAARGPGLSLNLNMTAADVLRDADLLPLYKRAGVDNIVMGVESLEDETVARIGKDNPFAVARQAVLLARTHGIVALVNVIYGLRGESVGSLARTARRVFALDPDVLNAMYLTPHHWTVEGRDVDAADVIQPDQRFWTYRNQVLAAPRLAPWQLFLGVKLTEALFHLRPRALWRMVAGGDARYRKVLRAYLSVGVRVVLAEIAEFVRETRFVARGSVERPPGFPARVRRVVPIRARPVEHARLVQPAQPARPEETTR